MPKLSKTSHFLILLATFLIATQTDIIAAKKLKFRASKTHNIDSVGITLKLPKDSKAQLQSTLVARQHEVINGKRGADIYVGGEIWLYNEQLGKWEDPDKNAIILKKVSSLIPVKMMKASMTMANFKAGSNDKDKLDFTKTENQSKWYSLYAGGKYAVTPELVKGTDRKVTVYSLKEEPHEACYMFHQKGKNEVYFIQYILNKKVEAKYALSGIKSAVKATKFFKIRKSAATKKSSSQFQKRGTDKNKTRSPEFIASLERVIKEIGALSSWWYVETDDYVIASDLSNKQKKLARKIQEDITFLRNAYEQIQPAWSPFKEVSVVKVFGDRKGYVSYVGKAHEWSGGLWSPGRKELIVSSSSAGASKKFNFEQVLSTTYHEAYHQYNHYACEETQTSQWFNEGHACFFENSKIKSGKLSIEEDQRYFPQIMKAIKANKIDFKKQLFMGHQEFYKKNKDHNYAFAWSLVYYLRKYCWNNSKSPYSKVLDNYIANLKKLRNENAATKATFDEVDLEKLKADYIKFWNSKSLRKKTERRKIFKDFKFKKS